MVSLPADRQIKRFGRDVVEDDSTPTKEYEARLFPLSRAFDASAWRMDFERFWKYDRSKIELWNDFEKKIVKRFEQYQVPVIECGVAGAVGYDGGEVAYPLDVVLRQQKARQLPGI